MRLPLRLSLLLAWLPLVGVAQQTVVVTSSAGAGGLGLYSDGVAWPTAGGFTFEVGVFPAGFDPATAERASWIAAWIPARAAATDGVVNTWFKDGSSTYFSIAGSSTALRTSETPGSQYYVWGYNTKTIGTNAEWVLLTNSAWRVIATTTPRLPDQFDTKDEGTAALVGRLSNAGQDLQSAKAFASGLTIAAIVSNFTVPVGQPATLSVTAVGAGLSYQWYVGEKGDTSAPVAGAVRPTHTVSSLTTTTRYWVRISDGVGTNDSNAITVTAAGSGNVVNSVHAVASLGYIAGQRVTVRNQISYTGTLGRLDVSVLLPAGWSYLGGEISGAQLQPSVGKTDLLEWAWTTAPSNHVTLIYTVAVPAGTAGDQSLTALVTALRDGIAHQGLSLSDPLVLKAGPRFHSSDTNRDSKIDLQELTRLVELYNTRAGTVRTGVYRVKADSEDGFAPDFTTTGAVMLANYHTADNSPRDGRISLVELTRVIELFNVRAGSSRTGSYHARGDTSDGFVTGAAP